jgi:hypothetical protein
VAPHIELAHHVITDFLDSSYGLRIQPSDKFSESRNFFSNRQIAIGLGHWREHLHTTQIKIDRHGSGDLGKLLGRIDDAVLKPYGEHRRLEIKLSFLNILLERQKWRARRGAEKARIAIGKDLEISKIPLQFLTEIIGPLESRVDAIDKLVVAMKAPPPDPIGEQRIEWVTIYKNHIGNPRCDRLEDTAGYLRRGLVSRGMSDGGVAAVNHRGGMGMEANHPLPEVPLSYPNIKPELVLKIRAAAAEQSYDISCSVVPQTRNSPTPVLQATENGPSVDPSYLPSFAGGLSRESDKSAEYLHWTKTTDLLKTSLIGQPSHAKTNRPEANDATIKD